MNITSKKNLKIFIFVLVAVITLGVGYAAITAITLNINGTGTASAVQENFKVHFTGTPTITENMGSATINENDNTIANLEVTGLTKKGDTAKAVYTVINESNGVGASISLEIENSNTEYFKITEKIEETELKAGEATLVTVTVELVKTPIEDGITTTIKGTLTASPIEDESVTSKGSSEVSTLQIKSFSEDSWSTIQKAVKSGNTSLYKVGDTKKVTIGEKEYKVRIANKTTPEECSNEGYSQTACGFVVEFIDIITTMQMRDTATNEDGYPATLVYSYLKNTLYEQLPNDLQSVIKITKVISKNDNFNEDYISNDYLYLLSQREVLGFNETYSNQIFTKQLDYYSQFEKKEKWGRYYLNEAKKAYEGIEQGWWCRESITPGSPLFAGLNEAAGDWIDVGFQPTAEAGVSPAFRIG